MQSKLFQQTFSIERFSSDNNALNHYTGFRDYATLDALYTALEPSAKCMMMDTTSKNAKEDKFTSEATTVSK